MDSTENDYLQLCIKQIEEKYHPAGSDVQMKQRDFEYLIDLIEENSGIKLSISTLKRLWRDKGNQNPHPSTLDGLSSLLGYKDWLDFKLNNKKEALAEESKKVTFTPLNHSTILGAFVFILIAFGMIGAIYFELFESKSYAEDVDFSATNTVSKGVPNTVIFNYDFKGIEADSFFIQQDWNPKHKDRIDPEAKYFSSIYYMPGFHKAKLIADETILKIERVHIQTDGWMSSALYNYDERPVYLRKDESPDGILTANEQDILDSSVDIERFDALVLLNIREYGDLDGHNFRFDTKFRYKTFLNDPCPSMRFTIHTEVHIYFVPLTLKGCVSNIDVKVGENYLSGRENDFSNFGADIYEWQDLSLHVEDKVGKVYLNGEQIFETTFEEDFGKIVGLDYRFSGLGEVDYLKLSDLSDNIVYEETFDE